MAIQSGYFNITVTEGSRKYTLSATEYEKY